MSSVFIIANEWGSSEGESYYEITNAKYFETEDEAWDALSVIAESVGQDLQYSEKSITVSTEHLGSHVQWEEFYIEELTRG